MNDIRVDQILRLISLKQEGAYWDFKKEWHSQKSDLLHDIMCFANNLVNLDCYIIIGVDEGNDYAICDIKADPNRKNTQKLVDFLKDKKFAGGVRPLTMVESCEIDGKIIDVVAGTFFICGAEGDHFSSIPKELQKKYEEKFKKPEAFLKMGRSIMAIPTEPTASNPKPDRKAPGMEL